MPTINPEITENGTVTYTILPLAALLRDDQIQQRAQTDMAKVDEYADLYREGRDLGRVVAFSDGERYLLADGFHRTLAAQIAEVAELPVEVHAGTLRDAIFYATSHNLHGKPLSNADKHKRVRTLLADPEWRQWSNNAIAKHCGVTHTFVNQQRKSFETVSSENEENNPAPTTTRTYINKRRCFRSVDFTCQTDT
jgi:hypothetical protein